MSFEEEWARHKAVAAEKMASRTQLNHAGAPHIPEPAPGQPVEHGDLVVSQKDLAAVGDAAFWTYSELVKYAYQAEDETQQAQSAIPGFAFGEGLGLLVTEWRTQTTPVLDAFAQVSNHLDFTKTVHATDDHAIATSFSIRQLEAGFDERTQLA